MAETNFSLDQGSDFKRRITIKDSDNSALNLTGRTFSGAAKKDYRTPENAFSLNITILDQTSFTGQVELTVLAEDTRDLSIFESTPYLYDIKQTVSGEESILLYGKMTVNPRVSK